LVPAAAAAAVHGSLPGDDLQQQSQPRPKKRVGAYCTAA
jgi:hypothetical protein